MEGKDFVITRWCACITESEKDEETGKALKGEGKVYKFRLSDDDWNIYAYGESRRINFAPLDEYEPIYGVTNIEYYNPQTRDWEVL